MRFGIQIEPQLLLSITLQEKGNAPLSEEHPRFLRFLNGFDTLPILLGKGYVILEIDPGFTFHGLSHP